MGKVALRGLLSRKLRSVLTGFAVVIGVASVVGTLVFTDTINASFTNLFERVQKGVDVDVEAHQAVKVDFSAPPTMPASALATVKNTPGVEAAEGSVNADGTLLKANGKPVGSNGPPTLIVSAGREKRFQSLGLSFDGRPVSCNPSRWVFIWRAAARIRGRESRWRRCPDGWRQRA